MAESFRWRSWCCMETLSPLERAVFLLHDVFDYSHAEVAEIVGKRGGRGAPDPAPRQAARRGAPPRFSGIARAAPAPARRVRPGLHARRRRGPQAPAGRRRGHRHRRRRQGARGAQAGRRRRQRGADAGRPHAKKAAPEAPPTSCARLNGDLAIVRRVEARIDTVLTIATDGEKITEVEIVRNPDKLARV